MYPYLRVGLAILRAARAPRLRPGQVHVVRTRCWPGDIDLFAEMNNGRSLSVADIGRLSLAMRHGLWPILRRERGRMTLAGATVRYRRRIPLLAAIEIRSRAVARDDRFLYLEQTILRGGEPAHHMVFRAAVVGAEGIVPSDRLAAALGAPDWRPEMPRWLALWSESEAARPWPPEA